MVTFDDLKKEAIKKFGQAGAWAYDQWENLNETFFYGKNKAGPIVWGSSVQEERLGCYSTAENLIYLPRNLLRPICPTSYTKWGVKHFNERIASDVLLHEMIHQRIHQTGGWTGETSHNNERFVAEVNRISKLLGLDVKAGVIKKKIEQGKATRDVEPGSLTLREISDFPYSSRPGSYYYEKG